jgi:NosL
MTLSSPPSSFVRINKNASVRAFTLAASLVLAVACKKPNPLERCGDCGMSLGSPILATLRADDKATADEARFDSVKCAFRYQQAKSPTQAIWVREYYTGTLVPARAVVFVRGSDVTSPMGKDLVAVGPSEADKFIKDHKGKAKVQPNEVDNKLLRAVDTE